MFRFHPHKLISLMLIAAVMLANGLTLASASLKKGEHCQAQSLATSGCCCEIRVESVQSCCSSGTTEVAHSGCQCLDCHCQTRDLPTPQPVAPDQNERSRQLQVKVITDSVALVTVHQAALPNVHVEALSELPRFKDVQASLCRWLI